MSTQMLDARVKAGDQLSPLAVHVLRAEADAIELRLSREVSEAGWEGALSVEHEVALRRWHDLMLLLEPAHGPIARPMCRAADRPSSEGDVSTASTAVSRSTASAETTAANGDVALSAAADRSQTGRSFRFNPKLGWSGT